MDVLGIYSILYRKTLGWKNWYNSMTDFISPAQCCSFVRRLTHNSVFSACLLAHLYLQLLLLSQWVSVFETKIIHFCLWVLPVHLDWNLRLAKDSDIINSWDIWEEKRTWWKCQNRHSYRKLSNKAKEMKSISALSHEQYLVLLSTLCCFYAFKRIVFYVFTNIWATYIIWSSYQHEEICTIIYVLICFSAKAYTKKNAKVTVKGMRICHALFFTILMYCE